MTHKELFENAIFDIDAQDQLSGCKKQIEYLEVRQEMLMTDIIALKKIIKTLREEKEALEATRRTPSRRGRW
jgi:predicted RNase H-like nuclease (RuvC/YqgF family)